MNDVISGFIAKWATPAGLMIILGFVIWLAQLNWQALHTTAKNAEQDQILKELLAQQVEVSGNVAEAALMLSIVSDELKSIRKTVIDHTREAEMWKERIRNNSADIINRPGSGK